MILVVLSAYAFGAACCYLGIQLGHRAELRADRRRAARRLERDQDRTRDELADLELAIALERAAAAERTLRGVERAIVTGAITPEDAPAVLAQAQRYFRETLADLGLSRAAIKARTGGEA